MISPITGKEMSLHKEIRTLIFRKEEFKVVFHLYKCVDTGEKFEDDELSKLNYNQLVNQYRAKYSIPFPEQIKAIRGKYGQSAAKMSEILGFGINSYRHYEAGEIPIQSNANLIQLAGDPGEFKKLVEIYNVIEKQAKSKLLNKISVLIEEQKGYEFDKQLEDYFFGNCLPNSKSGFKVSDLAKFTEMVVFFTEKLQPWKTKMNKLLFYTDFTMYQQTGFSISGMQYKAIPMGPVPNNFNSIFELLANKDEIDISYTAFKGGGIGGQFKPNPNRQFNPELLSLEELQVLDAIYERFKSTSTKEIIEISHKEKGWIENMPEREIIDYNFSFNLT